MSPRTTAISLSSRLRLDVTLRTTERWRIRLGAMLLFLAAAFGTVVASGAYVALCPNSDVGHCAEGRGPEWELVGQLVLAGLGVIATAAMLLFAWRGKYRVAPMLLGLALGLYAGSAVLLDIATHGDLTLF